MTRYLLILLLLFISENATALFKICPVEKYWLNLRQRLLCSTIESIDNTDCTDDYVYFKKLFSNVTISVVKNTSYNVPIENFSLCGLKSIVLNVDFPSNFSLSKYCGRQGPTIVLPLTGYFDLINITTIHKDITNKNCHLAQSFNNDLMNKFIEICSYTMWLTTTNRDNCLTNQSTSGFYIQKIFGDTYWEDGYKKLMPNKTFRIGTILAPPFMNKTIGDNGTVYYNGIIFQLLKTTAYKVGFNYNLIESQTYGNKINGEWNGLVGMLYKGEVDMVAASLTITESRSQVIDFTASFTFEEVGILIREPLAEDDLWKMCLLFSYQCWIVIFITTCLSVLMLYLLHLYAPNRRTTQFNRLNHCGWYIFSAMLNQPEDMSPISWSVQTFLVFFLLYVFVILAMYSGGLIALLTSVKIEVQFEDLNGLAAEVERGKFKVCTEANTGFVEAVKTKSIKSYEILAKYFEENPSSLATAEECEQRLLHNTDVAYLNELTRLIEFQNKKCNPPDIRFMILSDTFYPGNFAFAVPKGSPLLSILTYQIIDAVEAGFVDGWKTNYSQHQRCELRLPNQIINAESNVPLNIVDLGGVFILLAVGLLSSLAAFIIEHYKSSKEINRRTSLLPNKTAPLSALPKNDSSLNVRMPLFSLEIPSTPSPFHSKTERSFIT